MSRKAPRQQIEWYAVLTRPQQEQKASEELRRLGYWTHYPHHRVRRRRRRPGTTQYIVEWVEKPYFSRYIFVALRYLHEGLFDVNEADAVSTVVYFAGEPLLIPNRVMDELIARGDEDGLVGAIDTVSRERFQKDQAVQFKDNSPLAGLFAQVAVDAGKEVRIWFDVLGARREISVAPEQLAKIA